MLSGAGAGAKAAGGARCLGDRRLPLLGQPLQVSTIAERLQAPHGVGAIRRVAGAKREQGLCPRGIGHVAAWAAARGARPTTVLANWHIALDAAGLAAFVAAFPDLRYEVRAPTLDDLFHSLAES